MKRFCLIRPVGLFLFSCILMSCGREANEELMYEENDKIQILYDIEQVETREEASVFTAEWYRPEEALLKEQLLKNDIVSEESNAFGKSIYTGNDDFAAGAIEAMTIYDGGENAGIISGVYGGFCYYLNSYEGKAVKDYQDRVVIRTGHPDNIEQLLKYNSREDFEAFGELKFMDVQEATEYVENVLLNCNVPDIQIDVVYALDADTLNIHEKMRCDYIDEAEEHVVWQMEDEAYLMAFSQMIDGIPLINHVWETESRSAGEATETEITVILSDAGIVNMDLRGLVTVLDEGKKYKLISAKDAEELFRKEYNKELLINNIYVENLKLEYISLVNGDSLELVPAWVFCVAREQETEALEADNVTTVKSYEHFIVNAITGERILKAVKKG